MNEQFKWKVIYCFLTRRKSEPGFTLLELMVVMIFLGVLFALSLPHFLRQVGKAREVEIINAIGTINRSQLAYHWEFGVFCCQGLNETQQLKALGVGIQSKYISVYDITATSTTATLQIGNNNYSNDGTRGFSSGAFYDTTSATYHTYVCRSFEESNTSISPTITGNCGPNAERLK